mmetsp:Transcript_70275/g.153116  ORF Transcript_70275/g.153116 Transcript_70275/m.153116 type:complete len:1025 (-) Transcript_70275:100-3174(-)
MPASRIRSTTSLLAALALLGSLLVVYEVDAVDRSKFRTCEQGSFCRRYRKFIQLPQLSEGLWSVVPTSREEAGAAAWTFLLKHRNEAEPHLKLTLNAYASGIVRFRVNEVSPVHPRHVIPAGDVVVDPAPGAAAARITSDEKTTIITFESDAGSKVKVELLHSPISMSVAVDGRVVQRLNARNYLNFERYRKAKAVLPPDSQSDAAAQPEEVLLDAAAFKDVDTKGLWEEEFGGHTDKKPRGPASLGMDVTFEGDVPSLFGLPEHMTKASLPFYDEPYRFFNLDVFEYENNEPMALYGAVPMIWAIHRGEGQQAAVTSAFLWINPSETFVKLERGDKGSSGPAHAWWTSESGVLDAAVFVGPAPAAVSAQFHSLTGHAPMPGLWALGKHQCRWNYMSQKDTLSVDSNYDKYDIPYDVIWLDIEHTDGKAYFTWHPTHFPNPQEMVDTISSKRRKFVNVVDPHIKKDEKFHVYKEIRDQGLFIKKVDWKMIDDPTDVKPADWETVEFIDDPNAGPQPPEWDEAQDGKWEAPKIPNPAYKGEWKARQVVDPSSPRSDFEGWCWPGTSGYPDFTNPKMREYWGSQFALDKYKGTNADLYVWNDMNEPSVFNGPEVTCPRDAIHPHGDVEHRDVHNMYGYYVHRATFEGLEKRVPGDRPFVLTRSFFIGSHKYSAIWTGDNYAKWEHLSTSIAMVGALTLAGQSLVGADVGGFFKHPDSEMVIRWYQLAVLAYPFLRNHAHLETPRREPWMYDEDTLVAVKASLQLRYKLLPLWYTVFEEYHRLGKPVVRPLFWDFLSDPETHADEQAVENQIMLGDVLLVHGIGKPMSQQKSTTVYLPAAPGWYDIYTGSFATPGKHGVKVTMENIPAFFRAGSIVPTKNRIRRSSSCMAMDPHTLNIYLDPASGEATGRLYLDDTKTKKYQEGEKFDVHFQFKGDTLKATSAGGKMPTEVSPEVERVEIFGLGFEPKKATLKTPRGTVELPQPMTRPQLAGLGAKLGGSPLRFAATLKIKPWIDLTDGLEWSVTIN